MIDKLIYACMALFAVLMITYFILKHKSNKSKDIKSVSFKKRTSDTIGKIYYWCDKAFRKNFLTAKYYSKIVQKVELVTPADKFTVSKIASKNMLMALMLAAISLLFMLFVGSLDIFYIMMCCLSVYIMFTHTLNYRIEKQEYNLLEQFSEFLSEVRHYYHETNTATTSGMIDEAVYSTIDNLPYEMSLHAQKIYDILISEDVEYNTQKYNEICPNHYIMTFLASCVTTMKYDDKKIGEQKTSVFLKGINYLKQEVNTELLKRKKLKRIFSSLVWIAVAPIFFIKPLESWLSSSVRDAKGFYESSFGTLTTIIIFLITLLSYTMINRLKEYKSRDQKEHMMLKRIGSISFVKAFLTKQINKHYSKSLSTNDMLKSVGENMGPNLFLLQRLLFAFAGIILCTTMFFTINFNHKRKVLTDFEDSFVSSAIKNDTYAAKMRDIAEKYMKTYKRKTPNYDKLVNDIYMNTTLKNKTYADMVANEVITRTKQYADIYYRWWYIPITILVGIPAYQIPLIMIKYRKKIMSMSMEDEVVQFQTIILMLMHIDRMSLDIILEWMERFAFTFKEDISQCIQNLEMGDIKALENLKANTHFSPFERLVDNLLAIDKAGVENAFDEIETEREYYSEKRKDDNEATINNKQTIGIIFTFAPLMTLIVCKAVLPIISIAISSYGSFPTLY